jgi:hypothetical protein
MKTYISDSDFQYYNTLLKGLPALYETRNAVSFTSDTPSKMAFRILVERLCLDMNNDKVANKLLMELLVCHPTRKPCGHICCPSCRSKKQHEQATKALRIFEGISNDNAFFLTALMPMTPYLTVATKQIAQLRKTLRNKLRTYLKEHPESSVNVMGAFEYDLKTINEYKTSSDRAKKLFDELGFDASQSIPMWLPHLHAIVAPASSHDLNFIRTSIHEAIFGGDPVKYAIELKSFRSDRDVSENISEIAKYMWKVRLQHSDNIFATKDGTSRAKYKSVFPSQHLCQLVNTTKSNGSFKTLKFDVLNRS